MSSKTLPHRLSALTDGVFAIVMTILILDIKVPHDMAAFQRIDLEQFLKGQFQDVLLYMIVFIALAYLWYLHHIQSHYITHTDRNHLWMSLLSLMFVALVPFSSSLVNKFTDNAIAELFLAVNMFIIGILNYRCWAYATKDRRLVSENISDHDIVMGKRMLLIFPIVALFSMAVAFIYPVLSYYVLFTAPLVTFFAKQPRIR